MAGPRGRREVGPGSLGRGRRPAGPPALGLALARLRRTTRDAGLQVCGRGAGCGGLRGVLLGVAQAGDRGGQATRFAISATVTSGASPVIWPVSASSRAAARSWSPSRVAGGIRPYRARPARS